MNDFFRNEDDEIYIPEHRSTGTRLDPKIYELMGDQQIVNMIRGLYKRLAASDISPMFSRNIDEAVNRSASFFVQILGGPAYYNSKFGAPRMRMRHFPFKIDSKARDIWLKCFYDTLENPEGFCFPNEHKEAFIQFLNDFSGWMVNTNPPSKLT